MGSSLILPTAPTGKGGLTDNMFFICSDQAPAQARAAARKGGAEAPAAIPDDRGLSTLSRCVFQAGFSWRML